MRGTELGDDFQEKEFKQEAARHDRADAHKPHVSCVKNQFAVLSSMCLYNLGSPAADNGYPYWKLCAEYDVCIAADNESLLTSASSLPGKNGHRSRLLTRPLHLAQET